MGKPKLTKERKASHGSITLVEEPDGSLSTHLDIHDTDGVDESTMFRIRCAIAGLGYLYERDNESVENLGRVFMEGIEYGMKLNESSDKESNMGFRAKLKDEK